MNQQSTEPTSKILDDDEPAVKALGNVMGELFAACIAKIGHENVFRSCYKCHHWQEGAGNTGCVLYHAIPPVRIIVVGCDSFQSNDKIPF